MIDEATMYWLTRMDILSNTLIFLSVAACIASGALFMRSDIEENPKSKKRMCSKGYVMVGVLMLCVTARIFTPTTREMVAIKVIPMLANNEDLKGLGADTIGLAREWMDELRPNKKNGPSSKEPSAETR